MAYALGIDVGGTDTSASVVRRDGARPIPLGSRRVVAPSVVFEGANGALLVGEAAERRGTAEPDRTHRGFLAALAADCAVTAAGATPGILTSAMVSHAIDTSMQRLGHVPTRVALVAPAERDDAWRERLVRTVAPLDADGGRVPVATIPAPVAAAEWCASRSDIPVGAVVVIIDAGGIGASATALLRRGDGPGQFDLVATCRTEAGGGAAMDRAVLAIVDEALGGAVTALDRREPIAAAALGRLVQDCRDAKELLSGVDEVSLPVGLPGVRSSIRVTRAALEQRTAAGEAALRDLVAEVFDRSGCRPGDAAVALVGGCAYTPFARRAVADVIGRRAHVPDHAEHAASLGAAITAGRVGDVAAGGSVSVASVASPPAARPEPAAPTPATGAPPGNDRANGPADARSTPPEATPGADRGRHGAGDRPTTVGDLDDARSRARRYESFLDAQRSVSALTTPSAGARSINAASIGAAPPLGEVRPGGLRRAWIVLAVASSAAIALLGGWVVGAFGSIESDRLAPPRSMVDSRDIGGAEVALVGACAERLGGPTPVACLVDVAVGDGAILVTSISNAPLVPVSALGATDRATAGVPLIHFDTVDPPELLDTVAVGEEAASWAPEVSVQRSDGTWMDRFRHDGGASDIPVGARQLCVTVYTSSGARSAGAPSCMDLPDATATTS